jgi:hypothetical protein
MEGLGGHCFVLASAYNILFIGLILVIALIPSTTAHNLTLKGTVVSILFSLHEANLLDCNVSFQLGMASIIGGPTVLLLPLCIICTLYIYFIRSCCRQFNIIVLNAVMVLFIYLAGLVVVGKMMFSKIAALNESYYVYVNYMLGH